ncbi:hypothetical protein [Listeria newyorkensis]|uniref:Uncharacterized protein n=1 Tax=Listeria newyorkensis TaxID=1497681 RepID=A0A841YZ94_9LIST|nr:hypothetical protein [Listeria newyorkensis]MBC1458409.1 hypothetical protein [Listeria newyorkensis]
MISRALEVRFGGTSHDAEKGRQFHYIQLHIEVLKKQTTLSKNHNKARSVNDDTSKIGAFPQP